MKKLIALRDFPFVKKGTEFKIKEGNDYFYYSTIKDYENCYTKGEFDQMIAEGWLGEVEEDKNLEEFFRLECEVQIGANDLPTEYIYKLCPQELSSIAKKRVMEIVLKTVEE